MSIPSKRSMRQFFFQAHIWSEQTFGDKKPSGAVGSLKHLKREVEEAIKKPKDLIEYADIMHLIFDATWRAGYSYDDLVNACFTKLAINKGRVWGKPDLDGVCEHIDIHEVSESAREWRKQQALEEIARWEESNHQPLPEGQ